MCRPPTGGLQRRAYVKWFFLFRKAFLINQSIPHPSSDTDQSPEESGPTTSTHLASSAANAAALVGPPRLPVILSPPSGGTERSESLVMGLYRGGDYYYYRHLGTMEPLYHNLINA